MDGFAAMASMVARLASTEITLTIQNERILLASPAASALRNCASTGCWVLRAVPESAR